MHFIFAPQLDFPLQPRPPIPWDELVRHGEIEVPSETDGSVREIVRRLISEQRPDLIGAEPHVDAPAFSADLWWLATVRREGELAIVRNFDLGDAFGIDEHGLVHFAYPREMPLHQLARAIAEGHYDSDEDYLVVTRTGEFGGNGFGITSLVIWLLQEFPSVLLGAGVDRGLLRHDMKRREELEALAAAWAGQHVLYPMKLKQFVESKDAWFVSVLAQRLAMSTGSARRLLDTLGYEQSPHDEELMEISDSFAARALRQQWEDVQWEDSFVSIDELLDAGTARPESRPLLDVSDEDWEAALDVPRRSGVDRFLGWIRRR
ncbi:hypothetical protein SAMN04489844_1481 [Nocardioides exalbidus]|uniref:Uncharacterized protein n=1 Tax=Nocardioides exalbidus TaxID=402596 RepID=A0A1H4NYJ8_9ACTN|nr:hypothetical protein [Nocardioides exalbidus]SEC00085.1 hypothetical protein SAMN04489844_1481 [Nocardioides exalbidus]